MLRGIFAQIDWQLMVVFGIFALAALLLWWLQHKVHPCQICPRDPHDREECRKDCVDLAAYNRAAGIGPGAMDSPEGSPGMPHDRVAYYLVQINLQRARERSAKSIEERRYARMRREEMEAILRLHGIDPTYEGLKRRAAL